MLVFGSNFTAPSDFQIELNEARIVRYLRSGCENSPNWSCSHTWSWFREIFKTSFEYSVNICVPVIICDIQHKILHTEWEHRIPPKHTSSVPLSQLSSIVESVLIVLHANQSILQSLVEKHQATADEIEERLDCNWIVFPLTDFLHQTDDSKEVDVEQCTRKGHDDLSKRKKPYKKDLTSCP